MGFLGDTIYLTITPRDRVEVYQKRIRDMEWQQLMLHIPEDATFLDVGCGAGYAMRLAKETRNCKCHGIDPDPGSHGVGRFANGPLQSDNISQGSAESIPFDDATFDVVFCSHVLEHVHDRYKALSEMKRVLRPSGVLIIGMPTATMAWISLFSNIVFTTHIRLYELLRFFFQPQRRRSIGELLSIRSHSYPIARYIGYDLVNYRVSSWEKTVSRHFAIRHTLLPRLYPFPDYPQWFTPFISARFSSSVFFICGTKK